MNDPVQLSRKLASLQQELAKTRRSSLDASERGDFRAIASLTFEAARLNRAILELRLKEAQG